MKRTISKIIAFLLVVISGFCAASCSKDSSVTMKESVFEGGTHRKNYTETSDYLVNNGTSDYRIVLPDEPSDKFNFAAEELQALFFEATDVYLPVISESSVVYSDDLKVINLGVNSLSEQAGISIADKNLGYEGYVIDTVGKNIFIVANRADGVLWGVYGFLELQFGFEQFSADVYTLDRNLTSVKLRNYDVVDIPDIKVRANGTDWLGSTGLRRLRFSLGSYYDDYKLGPEVGAHTWNIRLSEETDYAEHPKWYSTGRDNMCYCAQGDPQEYELLVQRLAEVVENYMIEYPDGYIFSLGHADKWVWCTCAACSASMQKYGGSRAASGIKLLNEVAKKVDEWLLTEEGAPYQREYYLMLLSYGMTITPPAKYNEAAKRWEAYDDSVRCHERVVPWFAPAEMDFQRELYDESNEQYLDYFYGWMAVADKMSFYTYSCNYKNLIPPVDMLPYLQEFYQLAAKANAVYLHEDTGSPVAGWQVLRTYIVSKLGWNANEDVGELMDRFFDAYFAEASDSMKAYYESYKTFVTHQEFNIATSHGFYANIADATYWSKDLLDQWLGYIEQAIKDISFYKYVDPSLYQKYYDNIAKERVSVQFLMIELYGGSYDADFLYQMKLQCKEDCTRLGITMASVSPTKVTMGSYFLKWGV